MNPHFNNPSESARLLQKLKDEIAKDQAEIRREDPRLKALEAQIAREKLALEEKIKEFNHNKEHVEQLKKELAQSEREFAELGRQIKQLNIGKH